MTQQTSIDAYHELQHLHKIGNRQKRVLDAFRKYCATCRVSGSCDVTNLELSRWEQIPINEVTPRTYELRKYGYIVKSGKRKCSCSGKVVIAWKVSNLADNNTNTQEP